MIEWHVLPGLTTQETVLAENGAGLSDVEKVTYQVDSGPLKGNRRTVSIPVNLYTPDNVAAAIKQDVENASQVGGLTHRDA